MMNIKKFGEMNNKDINEDYSVIDDVKQLRYDLEEVLKKYKRQLPKRSILSIIEDVKGVL